ncbi:MAG: hypothetical protein NZ929_06870 [Aigarchaeota archaeon]|nr:hypothetical protein [Aigarchaeota archaeon]MDW7985751.1 RNA-binding domain-containing protein [Nitrososphaerota archaeon]
MSLQVLCHATEDEDKIMKSIENVVGIENIDKMKIASQPLKGYYNDPIILTKIEVLDPSISLEIVKNIFSRLSEYERSEAVKGGLEMGRHGGKLYIRLDKQTAYKGVLKLSDKDSIRIEIGIRGDINKFLKLLNIEG